MSHPQTPLQARQALLAMARVYLDITTGTANGPISVAITRGPVIAVAEDYPPIPVLAQLSPLQRLICESLEDTPRGVRQLASKIGHTANSHFRSLLAELVRRRLAHHSPDGYSRGGRWKSGANGLTEST